MDDMEKCQCDICKRHKRWETLMADLQQFHEDSEVEWECESTDADMERFNIADALGLEGFNYKETIAKIKERADYISRLEAVVRALDDTLEDAQVIDERYFFGVNVHKQVWDAMKAARSRVTLPPLTQTNQAKDGDKEATNGKA